MRDVVVAACRASVCVARWSSPRYCGYAEWIADVKLRIRAAQQRAALAVNKEMLQLYWQIGRDILERQGHEVRIEVAWDGGTRIERIVGNFRSGVARKLEASLGRYRRDLRLAWK